jgi:hypothetical protein
MTLRVMERGASNIDQMIKVPTIMKMQFHLFGRTDDITTLETADVRSHKSSRTFACKQKLAGARTLWKRETVPTRFYLVLPIQTSVSSRPEHYRVLFSFFWELSWSQPTDPVFLILDARILTRPN